MTNYVSNTRKILFDVIFAVLDLNASEVAREIHVHKSQVSRYISGDRTCPALEMYLIERIFGEDIMERIKNVE